MQEVTRVPNATIRHLIKPSFVHTQPRAAPHLATACLHNQLLRLPLLSIYTTNKKEVVFTISIQSVHCIGGESEHNERKLINLDRKFM